MPTYAFRCPSGHEFEQFYKTISASQSELPCPQCGAVAQRQLSGGAGLLFKGSGFYLTDYGKNAHRRDAKPAASGKDGSKSDRSAPASSDSSKGDGGKGASAGSGGSGTEAAKPGGTAAPEGKQKAGGKTEPTSK